MQFQTPLIVATLKRRYKRFLADVVLSDGSLVTAHCPNPGSMMGLSDGGMRVWLEPNDDPRKKLKFAWRLVELHGGHWCGIDTSLTNRITHEALLAKAIPELAEYDAIRPEVRYGSEKSRIDFLLTTTGKQDAYVEVKSVTLSRSAGLAEFPDSVTKRGTKHLRELSSMVSNGHRAVMLYIVQRTDCTSFRIADDIDPDYARAFEAARSDGVETLCYDTLISTDGVKLGRMIRTN